MFFRELGEDDDVDDDEDDNVVSDDEDVQGNDDSVVKKDPVVKRKNMDYEDLDLPRKKRKNHELSHTPDEDKRTIFIGNLSLQFKLKVLKLV